LQQVVVHAFLDFCAGLTDSVLGHFAGHLKEDAVVDFGHFALLVAEVHPHSGPVVLILEPEDELSLQRERLFNVGQSHFVKVLLDCERVGH
jgi:hypothetical protein